MTTTTVNPSSDGEVFSLGSYVDMQTGANQSADTAATAIHAGQFLSGPYQGYQAFLAFDTSSIPDTDTVSAVTLSLVGTVDQSTTDFVSEAYVYDWSSGGLTIADWRTPAQIGALTRVATRNSSAYVGSSTYEDFTSDAAFLTAINKTGTTYLMVTTDRFRASTTPTDNEYIEWASANHANSAVWPKLVVVHAAADDSPPLWVRPQLNVYRM